MISEKRSQAARTNGARSRGPVTLEGKVISARNSLRHGLLAHTIVLSNEGESGFKALFDMHVARFSPLDDVEMSMIEEMCASYWRLRRTWAMETSILESGIAGQPHGTPIEQTAGAFCDAIENRHIALLHRYETRLHGMYQRALKNLLLLRKVTGGLAPRPAGHTEAPCVTCAARTAASTKSSPARTSGDTKRTQALPFPPARNASVQEPGPACTPGIPNEPKPSPVSCELERNNWH